MSSHYVLGNGRLLLNFNRHSNLTDLYFPYVGHCNHVGGRLCGIAVLTPEKTLWIDQSWERKSSTLDGSLVAKVHFTHACGLTLHLTQAVHHSDDVLLVSVELENHHCPGHEFAVVFYHNFAINEHAIGDTAAWLPEAGGLVHYKESVYLLCCARDAAGARPRRWDIGRRDGTASPSWESINRREFKNTAIRQGDVDSALVLEMRCSPGETAEGDYWIAAGETLESVIALSAKIAASPLPLQLEQVHLYWQEWVARASRNAPAEQAEMERALRESLLIVRTQCDNRGGIVAANDTAVVRFNGDHYSYVWPRDAALVARIFLKAGFPDVAERFLDFCGDIVSREGYFLHKFRTDGTLGSSWHGWSHEGKPALPIQEDETALPVLLLADYFDKKRHVEFVQRCYQKWAQRSLQFLCNYVDAETGLPKPSHDLWEERYGLHAFTVASVWAALEAGGRMAQRLGFLEDAEKAYERAAKMKEAFLSRFWSEAESNFARCQFPDGRLDFTPDSSMHALWYFGLLGVDDERMRRAMQTTWNALQVRAKAGGIARYYDDYYFRITPNLDEAPGNPWVISTLWASEWFRRSGDPQRANELLNLVLSRRNEMGLLPEQWNPLTGAPVSVMPLTWSHAVLIETILAARS